MSKIGLYWSSIHWIIEISVKPPVRSSIDEIWENYHLYFCKTKITLWKTLPLRTEIVGGLSVDVKAIDALSSPSFDSITDSYEAPPISTSSADSATVPSVCRNNFVSPSTIMIKFHSIFLNFLSWKRTYNTRVTPENVNVPSWSLEYVSVTVMTISLLQITYQYERKFYKL